MTSTRFDTELFARAMTVYHDLLVRHRERLNALNVYPVPDADTGTNMALTMASVVDGLRAAEEPSHKGRVIARSAVLGAHGASGVILSQLLGAMAARIEEDGIGDGPELARALEAAAVAGYAAVADPVEGTILTVAKAAADAAESAGSVSTVDALISARSGAADALARTPEILPALGAAGVVDAGGAGYLLLLDALLNVATGSPLPETVSVEPTVPHAEADVHPRFEVVVTIAATPEKVADFRVACAELSAEASIVVRGDGVWVAHVHTDRPEATLAAALLAGDVTAVRVTDLVAQIAELGAQGRDRS